MSSSSTSIIWIGVDIHKDTVMVAVIRNRQANRALHMTVIVRLRYCSRTRDYMERRLREGKTKKEAIRCLKRYVAREVYRTLAPSSYALDIYRNVPARFTLTCILSH